MGVRLDLVIAMRAVASSVEEVLPDLPEPIPERCPLGYLNDETASESLKNDFFFKATCRWCNEILLKASNGYFMCMDPEGLSGCDVRF